MPFEPVYTRRAANDLAAIDKTVARRIADKIDSFCAVADPLRFAKPLKGALAGTYRFRIGDYRVIFELDRHGRLTILLVLRIGHRREIYD
jgi:mRNA interferase RelE/StbE